MMDRGKRRNVGSELLKILYNHLQLLAIMSSFPVQWPSLVSRLFGAFESLSIGGASMLSPDCILNDRDISRSFGSKIYVRALIATLVPIVSTLLILLFFRVRRAMPSTTLTAKQATQSTWVRTNAHTEMNREWVVFDVGKTLHLILIFDIPSLTHI